MFVLQRYNCDHAGFAAVGAYSVELVESRPPNNSSHHVENMTLEMMRDLTIFRLVYELIFYHGMG